jgi:DNA repair protein RecO (recombination protein O)
MESWEDQGIVLSARSHGENGAVVSLLTEGRGRHCGYIRGAHSAKLRALLQPGSLVSADWQSRVSDNLGNFKFEQVHDYGAQIASDALKLSALLSACSLCDAALPERESHPGMFHGLKALLDIFENDIWGQAYVFWEIALLRELGFSLDLNSCAGGGDVSTLAYVSPKTGRAVSLEKGEPYKDRLLPLPSFLNRSLSSLAKGGDPLSHFSPLEKGGDQEGGRDILLGLEVTGHFLEHWVFTHATHGVPEPRRRFQERMARKLEKVEAA